ncbi:hypothetical protein QFC21_006912 [Naganishia friedmannii]|uniref:Uncharacterized protein n=1 Tax=Naganishia friedmannii TaxID=89922 RepID=A0ACC2UZH4_9TREE|nr:hypothetical protein QFC21_006912 [Naganishia friedmannii]
MNILRQTTPRTLLRAHPLTLRRSLTLSAIRRFPTPPTATTEPAGETFSSKSQPSHNHLSPEAERAYIGAQKVVNGGGKVAAAVNAARDGRVEAFDGPARPRMRYNRPKEARVLPEVKSRWKYCLDKFIHGRFA